MGKNIGVVGVLLALAFASAVQSEESVVITNHYDPAEQRPKLDVEQVFLYRPETEWTYSHHASITFFKGRFYTMWSNGRIDEDAPGQRVLMCRADRFDAWEEPWPLVDSQPGKTQELTLTASGFHQHAGTLVAYFGQYEYDAPPAEGSTRPKGDAHHRDTALRAVTSTDGNNWSGIRDLGLPLVPNHGPEATRSGRLIISGNVMYPYTDDASGLDGWTMAGIYPEDMAGELFDDSEGFRVVQRRAGWTTGLCEGSFFQLDNGTLRMLLRSGEKRLWVTESVDDGATWSAPRATEFSDANAKFHSGRLPDGRYYYVGNPDPDGGRNPLVLSLSDDGASFDTHYILADRVYEKKKPGMYKGGMYGYPHTMIHEGQLYVIVSVNKEGVLVLRTRIPTS
ncbi:MAG: hypothetical protein GWP08_21860 [Nitrospiraceae bacterium]|nr:hypothetical protein [Nitrospiraceae bacterium]